MRVNRKLRQWTDVNQEGYVQLLLSNRPNQKKIIKKKKKLSTHVLKYFINHDSYVQLFLQIAPIIKIRKNMDIMSILKTHP